MDPPGSFVHWGFSGQEYSGGLPFPSPGESSRPRDPNLSSALQADSFPADNETTPNSLLQANLQRFPGARPEPDLLPQCAPRSEPSGPPEGGWAWGRRDALSSGFPCCPPPLPSSAESRARGSAGTPGARHRQGKPSPRPCRGGSDPFESFRGQAAGAEALRWVGGGPLPPPPPPWREGQRGGSPRTKTGLKPGCGAGD